MGRTGNGLYRRGRTIYWESWIEGIRYRRRIGDVPWKIALDISRKMRIEIIEGNFNYGRKTKDLSFDDAREKFESWAIANKRPASVRTYLECLRRLAPSFSGKMLSEISPFLIEAHRHKRIKEGAKVRVNREISLLKNLCNRMKQWGLYEGDNPAAAVKLTKEPKQRLRFLEPEEETLLLSKCEEPLRTMIVIGIYCGVRLKSEGLTLRWADIDFTRSLLSVQSAWAKNGKMRGVPMNSLVREALGRLPRKGEWVFAKSDGTPYTSVSGFNKARKAAGLLDVTVHTLRHTFATRLIENGVDLRTVQELGGWSDLKMLERYGHVSPSRKAAAVEGLIPPNIPASKVPNLVSY
ncbi:MAG: site-specific integrase [Nitrospira sp.]|nr:site-specific integrase [Nitrospira sp.]